MVNIWILSRCSSRVLARYCRYLGISKNVAGSLSKCTRKRRLPIHARQLVELIYIQLKSKLNDPLHLVQLMIICPRRKRERPDVLFCFSLSDRSFICIYANVNIKCFGLRMDQKIFLIGGTESTNIELHAIPKQDEVTEHAAHTRSIHAKRLKKLKVGLSNYQPQIICVLQYRQTSPARRMKASNFRATRNLGSWGTSTRSFAGSIRRLAGKTICARSS